MHSQQATRAPLTQGEGLAFNTDGCALGAHAVKNVRLAEGAGHRFRDATIYIPAHEGSNLASVVMVGGWGCGVNSMAAWGPFYASHGIVAMTIGTPSPWRDWPQMRADALRDGVAALRAEHARPGSALHDRLDVTRFAVQGWSLGGGGAQLAVMADPSLKCAIALSPHSGPGLPPVLSTAVPVLFLVGAELLACGQVCEALALLLAFTGLHSTAGPLAIAAVTSLKTSCSRVLPHAAFW